MYVAELVKTLDMSLPSYDSISNAKASVETVKGLAVEVNPTESAPVGLSRRSSTTSSRPRKEDGDENVMAKVLPSMGKGPKRKAESKTKEAPEISKKDFAKPARKLFDDEMPSAPKGTVFVDSSMPSYSETTASKKNPYAL